MSRVISPGYQQSINLAHETSIKKDVVLQVANNDCGVASLDLLLRSKLSMSHSHQPSLSTHSRDSNSTNPPTDKIELHAPRHLPSPSTAPTSAPATASA